MELNWPEISLGVVFSVVLGSIFTLFFQPGIEKRLATRRERRQRDIELHDALLAEEVARLAARPDLFAARIREGVLRILMLLVTAVIVTLFGLVVDNMPGLYFGGVIPFILALTLTLPAAAACSRLFVLSQGVRVALEEAPADDRSPQ